MNRSFGHDMWGSAVPLLLIMSTAVVALQHLNPAVLRDSHYDHQEAQEKTFCSWQCMIFTLQWPAAFCQSLGNMSLCHIPKNVTSWTIHGLWPQHTETCCNCWTMFPSDVQKLEAELNDNWPSLLRTRSSYEFWQKEWSKHGVCAACVDGINSPQKYFQLSLQLRQQYDLHKLLEDAGITPSCDRRYKVADVQQVLDPHLGGKYEIQCVTDSKGRELWFQVKVSLSRNLMLGCSAGEEKEEEEDHQEGAPASPRHPCPPQTPFYYLPINPEHPERPCS